MCVVGDRNVVKVKWSGCSPSTPSIRVRNSLTLTFFSVKFLIEKIENKRKEASAGPFDKKNFA